jgi:ribulose-phosphate 3-epimerase
MAIIVPAILEETPEAFDAKVFQVTHIPGVERIQVDFGDGDFVNHQTVDASKVNPLNPAYTWEAHLMIREPKNFLDYQIAGFKTVILHYEAFPKEDLLEAAISEIAKAGMTPGIALNPETPVSTLRYFGDTISHFTLLSVQPGFQGKPFIEQTFERVAELRKLIPHATIEVDGGIRDTNAQQIASAGADLLVAGSFLIAGESETDQFEKLKVAVMHQPE